MENKNAVHEIIDRLDRFAFELRQLSDKAAELARDLCDIQSEILLKGENENG